MSFECDHCGLILGPSYQLKVHALNVSFITELNNFSNLQVLMRVSFHFIKNYLCDVKFESKYARKSMSNMDLQNSRVCVYFANDCTIHSYVQHGSTKF